MCCAGASIAIDDRFEVWDSGYISVPFDFEVSVLRVWVEAAGTPLPAALPCLAVAFVLRRVVLCSF